MYTALSRHAFVVIVLLISWCNAGFGQTQVQIDITQAGGGYLLPIAIPRLIGESAGATIGKEMRDVLRQDLELTGLFRIADPATYIEEAPQALNQLHYDSWAVIGVAAVIAGQLTAAGGGNLATQMTLHDVAQRRVLENREYNGPQERRREMAHRFSNQVFRAFTGEDGPFDSQVVCAVSGGGRQSKDIMIMDYDGYGARRLVSDGSLNISPVLSPDGSKLAYTSYRNGTPDLYIRNVRTGQDERITSGPGLALPGSWSPDGRYLALNFTVDGNSEIFLYDLQSRRLTRLTNDWGIDVSPSFSPDGSRLVFTSDRGGSPQLYLTDINGSSPTRITYEGRYNTAPSWSPREDAITFVGSSDKGSLAIYTIRSDGSRLRRLMDGGGTYESPTWAPNGRFIMYIGGTGQRYILREGGSPRLVPSGPACLSSQWVPRAGQ